MASVGLTGLPKILFSKTTTVSAAIIMALLAWGLSEEGGISGKPSDAKRFATAVALARLSRWTRSAGVSPGKGLSSIPPSVRGGLILASLSPLGVADDDDASGILRLRFRQRP